jgi:hypothetical protein
MRATVATIRRDVEARTPPVSVDLIWIPLGAGASAAHVSGKLYEAGLAWAQHRCRCDLYHSALEILTPEGRYVIEQTPVPDPIGAERGVVATGAVGTPWAGRFRIFRYEVRRWLGGEIPDLRAAVDSPTRVSDDLAMARRVLEIASSVPTPVWGRDELGAGEMWNSNSVIAWILSRAGVDLTGVHPPAGGRAPGWHAGLRVARRGDLHAQTVEPTEL